MLNEDNSIEEVEKIITWWFEFSDAASIEDKIKKQDELAVYSWFLAKESADIKKDYNVDSFMRTVNVDRTTQKLMENKSISKAKAEIDSRLINKDLFEKYLQSQALSYKLDILFKQVNKILSAMQQNISYDKDEKKKSHMTVRQ